MRSASPGPEYTRQRLTRPLRLASELTGRDEDDLARQFLGGTVLVQVDWRVVDRPDARLIFLTLVNRILRFCPNILVETHDAELDEKAEAMASALHGPNHRLRVITPGRRSARDSHALVLVGTHSTESGAIVVNSAGWVGRVATGVGMVNLPTPTSTALNPIGAVAAGCLGSAAAFVRLVGNPTPRAHELSMLTGESSAIGTLASGPELPVRCPDLDGLLAGCGNVGNGWAAVVSELRLTGRLAALDRQSLAPGTSGRTRLPAPRTSAHPRSISSPEGSSLRSMSAHLPRTSSSSFRGSRHGRALCCRPSS